MASTRLTGKPSTTLDRTTTAPGRVRVGAGRAPRGRRAPRRRPGCRPGVRRRPPRRGRAGRPAPGSGRGTAVALGAGRAPTIRSRALRLLPAHLREGVQQRDQVLGGLDPADPDQRPGSAALGAPRRAPGSGPGVHAGVDGAQPARSAPQRSCQRRAWALPGVTSAACAVGLGGQLAVEGGEQGPYGGRAGRPRGAAAVVLAQPHAVLGDQQRRPKKRLASSPGSAAAPPDAAWQRSAGAERVAALVVPVERERAQRALQPGRRRAGGLRPRPP